MRFVPESKLERSIMIKPWKLIAVVLFAWALSPPILAQTIRNARERRTDRNAIEETKQLLERDQKNHDDVEEAL